MSDNQPTRTDADTAPWTSTPPASLGLCRRQRCYSLGRGSSRCWRLQLAPSPGRMSQRRLACIIHRLFLLLMTYLLAQFPAVFSGRLVSGGQGRGSRPSPARISRRICVVITSSSRGMHVSDTRRKTRIRSVLRSTYSILRCISGGLGGLSGGSWSTRQVVRKRAEHYTPASEYLIVSLLAMLSEQPRLGGKALADLLLPSSGRPPLRHGKSLACHSTMSRSVNRTHMSQTPGLD